MADQTEMLNSLREGQTDFDDPQLALVYQELRRMAAARLARQAPGQTLQATALVHEAYLKLMGKSSKAWESRRHFFGAAAQAMRQILVDIARRKRAVRHGRQHERVPLDDVEGLLTVDPEPFLDLHLALDQLNQEDPVEAEIVRLRYFIGLENAEVAEMLGISVRSVERHWAFAKAWLSRAMRNADGPSPLDRGAPVGLRPRDHTQTPGVPSEGTGLGLGPAAPA